MARESEKTTLLNTSVYYSALIFNIILGWVVAKINIEFLSVADYGRYSFFVIVIFFSRAFFGLGISEGTSRLLALSHSVDESRHLAGASIFWITIFFIPYTFILFLTSLFADTVFEVKIGNLLWLFAPLAGFILLHSHFNLLLRGWGRINLMSVMTILPRMFYILMLVFLVLTSMFSLNASLLLWFISFLITVLICIFFLKPNFSELKLYTQKVWHEVKSYGIHLYVSNILHEIFFHADKFVISYFLSDESMAYYALGYMITFPLTHFSTALSTSLFKKFSMQQKINPRVLVVNAVFISVSVMVFILLRESIIIYLFSENYVFTIPLILPLALAFGFSGLSKPYSLYLMARKHGRTVRNISTVIPIIHIVLGLYIIPLYGIIGAAWLTTGVYLLDLILFVISYLRVVRHNVKS